MMGFLMIDNRATKYGIELAPEFKLGIHSKDLMIKGRDFYAIWVPERNMWSTDENDVVSMIDAELEAERKKLADSGTVVNVQWMRRSSTKMIDRFHEYCQRQSRENYKPLDESLTFANTPVTREDYASKRLPYELAPGDIHGWNKLVSTLYNPEERTKIEWCIGAIVSGDSKKVEKFAVFYGDKGTGKSTIIKIIAKLFEGYTNTFDAALLGRAGADFAMEPFKDNPLVAINYDADLSKMDTNTRLNSITSHEYLTINEKHKAQYSMKMHSFLIMGSNDPVKIINAQSGIIRRLIDITPTGKLLSREEYNECVKSVDYELGAIAEHCLNVYESDPKRYDNYTPRAMMEATNEFYNFMFDNFLTIKNQDRFTIKQLYDMYRVYAEDCSFTRRMTKMQVREEAKAYFWSYDEVDEETGERSVFSDFKIDIFKKIKIHTKPEPPATPSWLHFAEGPSVFDSIFADYPAQYADEDGHPTSKWENVTTTLKDIDSSRMHYVLMDEQHVTIDFDIKDSSGEKSFEKNLAIAREFPPTYAELSKSGQGIHLEYIYNGDTSQLSHFYGENIEVKTFPGKASLRRKLTKNNGHEITTLSSGLPLKEKKPVVSKKTIEDNRHLRILIAKCLAKEYGATKPSMDFIKKLLDEAYDSGIQYDVNDMAPSIMAFAMNSTHQAHECLKIFNSLKLQSEPPEQPEVPGPTDKKVKCCGQIIEPDDLVFYDIEVFPNLLLVNWKVGGEGKPMARMINPTPKDIAPLFKCKLVGFNCRRYDNHILWARYAGYNNQQIFELSQRIIQQHMGLIREAYNLSYTDIYDFAAKKQSLKKWEIEMGIHHQELGLPWDKPVPEEKWAEVSEYCDNDVNATEKLFYYLKGDWTSRKILAKIAHLTPNDTTNMCTERFIFQGEKHPQLECPDLSIEFPGYKYVPASESEDHKAHNMYRGVDLGFGGYVYETVGYWRDNALLDVRSLHPHSAIAMRALGKYTDRFKEIVDLRVAIKEGNLDLAKTMFNGELAEFLDDPETASALAQALKIAINSVYGLTSASFENAFRDPRNVNNIVALRGALFMKTLQDEVEARGFTVAHIKTDSIKIPNATKDIIDFCYAFANKYGYVFEHEATYERMCLVNKAVYIARYATYERCCELYGKEYVDSEKSICKENKKHGGQWTATGKEFQIEYVFKQLFTHEPIVFDDLCETFQVTSALYLDYDPEGDHDYQFVGKVGQFTPVKKECHGGALLRDAGDKYDSAVGAKGYLWLESEKLRELPEDQQKEFVDYAYWNNFVETALDDIRVYVDPEIFINV